METQLPHALIKAGANVHLKDKVWENYNILFLDTILSLFLPPSLSVKNGWTTIEIAEVKSADEEAQIIPEWSRKYLCGGYKGYRDYEIVIELLRGNLVEPDTSPTHHVSNSSSFKHWDLSGAIIISSYSMERVQLLLRRRVQRWEMKRERSRKSG